MLGFQRTHFDVRNHMHLQTFFWKCSSGIFSSHCPKFQSHLWKLGLPKPWIDMIWVSNMWLQLILISLRCPSRLSNCKIFTFYLTVQSVHVSEINPKVFIFMGYLNLVLALVKMPLGLASICCDQQPWFWS